MDTIKSIIFLHHKHTTTARVPWSDKMSQLGVSIDVFLPAACFNCYRWLPNLSSQSFVHKNTFLSFVFRLLSLSSTRFTLSARWKKHIHNKLAFLNFKRWYLIEVVVITWCSAASWTFKSGSMLRYGCVSNAHTSYSSTLSFTVNWI